MGPRSRERGEPQACRPSCHRLPCFYGAALAGARRVVETDITVPNTILVLQWGRARGSAERGNDVIGQQHVAAVRFNGAALAGARRAIKKVSSWTTRMPLQWGRARGSAERGAGGWRSCGRARFNGAALAGARRDVHNLALRSAFERLQWGRARGSAERPTVKERCILLWLASMGPRSRERGEIRRE